MKGIFLTALALTAACQADKSPSALLPVGTVLAGATTTNPTERVAELYVSTEVVGFIEPCGCTSKPLGGVQRLATVLKRGRPAHALLDAGNLLFPAEPLTDTTREQHVLKARILARVYRQLGAVAINLGPSDLTLGAAFLKELQREGAVPWVSSNIRPLGEDGPAIAQSFLRDVGGIHVGVLGVATPESFAGVKGVAAIEYATAVRAEQALLRRRGAEIVVVLARVGEKGADDLARDVPEIDVIVRAPGTPIGTPPAPPKKVGSVIVLEAGSQGQHTGRLTLRFGAQVTRPIALDDAGADQAARRALADRKIRAFRTELDAWQADPTKADAVAKKRAQIAELEKQLAAPAPAPGPQPLGSVRVELVPLTEDVPPDPIVADVLAAYYAELKNLNLSKGDVRLCAKTAAAPTYVGTEACKSCHPQAYALWKTTKHGKAWATLESQNKHFDLTCIGCHTVGYQKPGGFCRIKDVGVLKDVGCENCHGAGSAHVTSGDKSLITRAANAATCGQCHVPEHSDKFAFAEYLPRILGPGHEARK